MLSAIEWRITGKCNEDCFYCYGPEKHIHPTDLELQQLTKVIVSSPVRVVRFSGGEPLLVKGLPEILKKLRRAGKTVVLSTNARRFGLLRKDIESSIDKLNVSLDGYDPFTHAINGRKASGFQWAIAALDELRSQPPGYVVKIGTVLTSRNILIPDLLQRMHALLGQYPIDRWKLYQYVPEGPVVDDALRVPDELFSRVARRFNAEIDRSVGPLEIDFCGASERDSAYFIVEPRGDVIVPIGDSQKTEERRIGNLLVDDFGDVVERWEAIGSTVNHQRNVSIERRNAASL